MQKTHPSDDAMMAALRRAGVHFTASIFHDGRNITHPLKTLALARQVAALLPENLGSSRKALVYVVTPEGRAHLVPDTVADPATNGEAQMGSLSEMAGKISPQSAVMKETARQISAAADKPEPPAGAAMPELPKALQRPNTPEQKARVEKITNGAKPKHDVKLADPLKPTPVLLSAEKEADARFRNWLPTKDDRKRPSRKQFAKMIREERGIETAKKAGKKPAETPPEKQESDVRKTATTTKSKARAPIKAKAKTTAKGGERSRYDWNAAEEKAGNGIMPSAPDFSAPTHERFRPLLAEVVKAAKAGDADALRKIKVSPISSSPKAIDRYKKLCIKALAAPKAKKTA